MSAADAGLLGPGPPPSELCEARGGSRAKREIKSTLRGSGIPGLGCGAFATSGTSGFRVEELRFWVLSLRFKARVQAYSRIRVRTSATGFGLREKCIVGAKLLAQKKIHHECNPCKNLQPETYTYIYIHISRTTPCITLTKPGVAAPSAGRLPGVQAIHWSPPQMKTFRA